MDASLLNSLSPLLDLAYREDVGEGDITTQATVTDTQPVRAEIQAKEDMTVCGLPLVEKIFSDFAKNDFKITGLENEGRDAGRGDTVLTIQAAVGDILTLERVSLNFLQRLSGIASKTASFVKALGNSKVKLLDTRKTTPGMRLLEKYAVKCGGGTNHRIGLFDGYLIKDNHIAAAGSVTQAIRQARGHNKNGLHIEIECKTEAQVEEAVKELVDIILLDNMDDLRIKKCIKLINRKTKIEVSGNITLGRIPGLARMEIDYISTGAVTHSAGSRDLSLLIY